MIPLRPLRDAMTPLLLAVLAGCSVAGVRTAPEAPYEVLDRDGPFELRLYPSLVVAETFDTGERAAAERASFRRLFRYIGGANEGAREIEMTAPVLQEPGPSEIPMTAPVLQERGERGWRMAFVLPDGTSAETAPAPTDSSVEVRAVPGGRVAVVRFSGSGGDEARRRQEDRLRQWMLQRGLRARDGEGDARFAGYDPPFTLPFRRRNEVQIDVR